MLRSHTCGELNLKYVGQTVTLTGWINSRRDHGNLIFFDLRDRWGKTQLVVNLESDSMLHERAEKLRSEFVVQVSGVVEKRPAGTLNSKLSTGEIEVHVKALEILNTSETPPFELLDDLNVSEELRLKYRYLDLRRPAMMNRLQFRHRIAQTARRFFDQKQFLEVETPILTKSTPEGARDFLVPSRLAKGCFYALPQSPQLFKQILMVSGVDRYFQLARCFRDEDFRADRQFEHTQIDVEMSFVTQEDIMMIIEELLTKIFSEVFNREVKRPLQVMTYDEAMNSYGSDKPDLRYGLQFSDATSLLTQCGLKVFKTVIETGGVVKGFKVSQNEFSRSELDELTKKVQDFGAKGLAWFKVAEQELESPIAKFLSSDEKQRLKNLFHLTTGDTLFLVADRWKTVCAALGELRRHLAQVLHLIPENEMRLLWVVDFPLFEWNEEEKRNQALHHPFTAPRAEDKKLLESEPLRVHAQAYDLVLNGTEIGGGSIRIHDEETQSKVFGVLGIKSEEAKEKFGFLLDALKFGAPPHGGIAVGLDRLCAMLVGVESIRDVIAFPKTQKGTCLMTDAPSKVYPKQLNELSLKVQA